MNNFTHRCSQPLYDKKASNGHADCKRKLLHLKPRTVQVDPLSTLLFNSLHQDTTTESDFSRTTVTRTPNAGLQTTFFSSAAHSNTRPPRRGLQRHPAKTQIISNTTSTARNKHGCSVRDKHRDPATRRRNQIHWSTHLPRRSPSRGRPPHQLRVGNLHEPHAGVDTTKIPSETQSETLRRNGGAISHLRFRDMVDDKGDEEETPDNKTTNDVDDQADKENIKTPHTSTKSPTTNHTTHEVNWGRTRLRPTRKIPTNKKSAAKTPTATPPSTTNRKKIKKLNWSHGLTT